jgi:hypothetical protein
MNILEDAINDSQKKGCLLTNTCSELENKTIKEIPDTIITFFIGMTVEVKLQSDRTQIKNSIHRLIQT